MESQSETFLLPGGLGYIGSITTVYLYEFLHGLSLTKKKKFNVVIADDLSNSHEKTLLKINQEISKVIGEPQREFVSLEVINLLDLENLRRLFRKQEEAGSPIRYIIHFAAKKAVGESVLKPLQYYQNNVVGTLNLFQCMEEFKTPNIIFSSSATVYKPGEYLDEETIITPSNPYGETKIAIEYLLKSVQRANGGRTISLRYFNPVGALNGVLGDSPTVFPNNLFPFIEQVAVGNREHLNVFGNDYPTRDGTGVRDYIHVKDLAKGHIAALKLMVEKDEKNENYYDYFNLGSGTGYSVLEIVNAYSKALGRELPHKIAPRREGDVAVLTANPTKAKTILGWQTEATLDEMCQDSLAFTTQNNRIQ